MIDTIDCTRRRLLRQTASAATLGAFAVLSTPARASLSGTRSLALVHTHTGEQIDVVYALDERYVPSAMTALNRFLRDHYTGEVGTIDPKVFDQLHRVQQLLGSRRAFEVISGFRCPATNARLHSTRGGGVARNSLHLEGRAIDVRLPGMPLTELRDAALSMQAGGVGFYPREQFVHLDTGRLRTW
jgi:uncharacterized protein YcbK (DUF882 family)